MGTCGFHMLPVSHSATVLYNACFAFNLLLSLDKKNKKNLPFPKTQSFHLNEFYGYIFNVFPVSHLQKEKKKRRHLLELLKHTK